MTGETVLREDRRAGGLGREGMALEGVGAILVGLEEEAIALVDTVEDSVVGEVGLEAEAGKSSGEAGGGDEMALERSDAGGGTEAALG